MVFVFLFARHQRLRQERALSQAMPMTPPPVSRMQRPLVRTRTKTPPVIPLHMSPEPPDSGSRSRRLVVIVRIWLLLRGWFVTHSWFRTPRIRRNRPHRMHSPLHLLACSVGRVVPICILATRRMAVEFEQPLPPVCRSSVSFGFQSPE